MGILYECDLCSFRNVARQDPIPDNFVDHHTMVCIRRANLDAMWSHETSTVEANVKRINLDYTVGSRVLSVVQPMP